MITSINIKNYILIDELTVNFSNGLNVITGETGAGKSILLNAVDIALGEKVSSSSIKKGAEKAVIELFVSTKKPEVKQLFEENDMDFEEETVIVREITPASSRIRVNGTIVNQTFIKHFREQILDVHTQHQTYTFLQPKFHISFLDNYAKDNYGEELSEYKKLFSEYKKLLVDLENAENAAKISENQIDFLKFQIKEIESAEISDIEEENKLKSELIVLENAEKLKELTFGAYWNINGEDNSLVDMITSIKMNISKAVKIDADLESTEALIIELLEKAKEISYDLRSYSENISNDMTRFNEVQERLYLFDKLKRKYGSSLGEILQNYEKMSKELCNIEYSEKLIAEIKEKIEKLLSKLKNSAQNISDKRKNYAKKLSKLIEKELEKLELPKSRFEIRIAPAELCQNGMDNVEFYISTNISQDLLPLAKSASGGELSRVMLALKTIFAEADETDTVIFDEIDTGISGKAAQSVADAIFELAKHTQIILITHQAIIASKAKNHLLVTKEQKSDTKVFIKSLDEEEKISAIASLASGNNSDSAREFAKSLLIKN